MAIRSFSDSAPQRGCDPKPLSAAYLEDEITSLSASIAVTTWRLLMLIAQLAPDAASDVSAETSDAFILSSNGFDNADPAVAARRADAPCHIAEQFLAHGPVPSRQVERYQVVVHVDRSVLSDEGHGDCCPIEHGGAIAAEKARRLVCDASVVMLEGGGDGELLPEVPKPRLRVRDIEAIVAEAGADVSAETSRSLWDGSRMDLDRVVGGIGRAALSSELAGHCEYPTFLLI
jgi:hypothetical protein